MMTTTPPQLTEVQFDAAWQGIPEAERVAGGVSQLAGRVIAIARPVNR